jgi:hypothetical protein
MAKKSVPQAAVGMSRPKPTLRFEMPDGLPKDLPEVESEVSLNVRGKLVKVAAKDAEYNDYACLTVRPESVTVAKGKKRG